MGEVASWKRGDLELGRFDPDRVEVYDAAEGQTVTILDPDDLVSLSVWAAETAAVLKAEL